MQCARHRRSRGTGRPVGVRRVDEFVDAATTQADGARLRSRGVFVAHPIQDRTDDEMRALADGAVDAVLAAVTA